MLIAGVAGVLVAASLAGWLAFNLGTLIELRREEIVARAERALGQPLRVGAVAASFWPLGIRLQDVGVGDGAATDAAPPVAADAALVKVRLWPLALGRIEAAGVALERLRLTVTRDEAGRWSLGSLGAPEPPAGASAGGSRPDRGRGLRLPAAWMLGAALSEIRDGTLEIRDRRGGGERRLVAQHVEVRAESVRLGGTARVRAGAVLFGGAHADTRLDVQLSRFGEAELERTPVVGRFEVRGLDLETIGLLLDRPGRYAGRVERVTLDLAGTLERFDATVAAERGGDPVRIGRRTVAMPPVSLHLRVRRDGERLLLDEARGSVGTLALAASGGGRLDPWQLDLLAQSEEGSEAVLPLGDPPARLSALTLRARVDSEGVRLESSHALVDGAPFDLSGRITRLDPLRLDGRFEGHVFGGVVRGEARPTAAEGVLDLELRASSLDLAALAARLAPDVAGRLEGTLDGSAALRLPVGDGTGAPTPAGGSGTLEIRAARLRGINLADLLLRQWHELPFAPQLVSEDDRSRYAELLAAPDTRVEQAHVPFTVEGGRLATEALSVRAGAYDVTGAGWIARDRELRFRGELRLSSRLSTMLRDDVHAARYLCDATGRVAIPFRVHGPLGRLSIEPDARRLRERGIQLLVERAGGRRGTVPPRSRDTAAPPGGEELADPIVERLHGMLQP